MRRTTGSFGLPGIASILAFCSLVLFDEDARVAAEAFPGRSSNLLVRYAHEITSGDATRMDAITRLRSGSY